MPVVFTDPIGKQLDLGRAAISESAAFQSWVSAVDAAAALDSIHRVMAHGQDFTWPGCLVHFGDDTGRSRSRSRQWDCMLSGRLYFAFEMDAFTESTLEDDMLSFMKVVFDVMDEVADYIVTGDGVQLWDLKLTSEYPAPVFAEGATEESIYLGTAAVTAYRFGFNGALSS